MYHPLMKIKILLFFVSSYEYYQYEDFVTKMYPDINLFRSVSTAIEFGYNEIRYNKITVLTNKIS